ncbi:MAG TPA: hypothetical protein PKC23_10445, partial [Candidatus Desulfobacillus sp.]|nr:hypothetical protein [Candidatus Desulfobacillus sp.]
MSTGAVIVAERSFVDGSGAKIHVTERLPCVLALRPSAWPPNMDTDEAEGVSRVAIVDASDPAAEPVAFVDGLVEAARHG